MFILKALKSFIYLCTLLFLFTPTASSADTTSIKTYILAGQSNGSGYGLAYGDVRSGTLIPNQSLEDIGRGDLLVSNSSAHIYRGARDTGLGSWESLAPGFAIWNGIRFGPELSLGYKLQAELNEPIAIIKYTPNGTSIHNHWLDERYGLLIQTVDNAKASAAEKGLSLDIQGVLWMQGESDSSGGLAPFAYEEGLTTLIAKVRDGLALPELRFHVAEIPDSTAWQEREVIWAAQSAIADADEHTSLVRSRDYPLFEDDSFGSKYIHFSTEGVVMLGEGFASSVLASGSSDVTVESQALGARYINNVVAENSIVVDGSLEDWSQVQSLGYDAETLQEVGVKADIVEGWIANDNNNLYIAYENNTALEATTRWRWQVFIDVDNTNPNGFKVDNNLNADYALLGSGLYKYTGSGSNWSWEYVTNVENKISGAIAEFKIPRLAIGYWNKLQAIFKTKNVGLTAGGVDTYPKPIEPIELHSTILNGQPVVWGESGGIVPMALSEEASNGATQLKTIETHSLLDNQLISYRSIDEEYYTAQVASTEGNVINLTKPIEASIAAGQNLWNFYENASSANAIGINAIADLAIRQIGLEKLSTGKHVLLGDGWFTNMSTRLSERLNNVMIVNKAVGRNTTAALLDRFDADVASENPDFVWVLAGIKDATTEVPVTDYLANMQAITTKIKSLGATPIIFDSQVAQSFYGHSLGRDFRTNLSHSYSEALGTADSSVRYQLTKYVAPPVKAAISNPKTIVIDGSQEDWGELEMFAADADDINQVGSKADFLEAGMAHDETHFFVTYKNDGEIDTATWWPWQIYLDTDKDQQTGFQIGNGVGADYVIQGDNVLKYDGTGTNWAWQFVERADLNVNVDIAELKFSRSAINNPDSLSTVLKTRNGIFIGRYNDSSRDSYPDLNQGHFNYSFDAPQALSLE